MALHGLERLQEPGEFVVSVCTDGQGQIPLPDRGRHLHGVFRGLHDG